MIFLVSRTLLYIKHLHFEVLHTTYLSHRKFALVFINMLWFLKHPATVVLSSYSMSPPQDVGEYQYQLLEVPSSVKKSMFLYQSWTHLGCQWPLFWPVTSVVDLDKNWIRICSNFVNLDESRSVCRKRIRIYKDKNRIK